MENIKLVVGVKVHAKLIKRNLVIAYSLQEKNPSGSTL